jgi:hydroxymethylglutaryl-CoA lyase
LELIRRFAELEVDGVTLCDTTGMAYPTQVERLVLATRAAMPQLALTAHFHNTRAMGLANVIAAVETGIERFDMALGGIGGCPYAPGASGNVATEDVVHMLDCLGYATRMNLPGLLEAASVLESLIGHPLPAQVSRAGPRLKRHAPPADFEAIKARALARESESLR